MIKRLGLKKFLLFTAAIVALVIFIMSFLAAFRLVMTIGVTRDASYKSFIWGASSFTYVDTYEGTYVGGGTQTINPPFDSCGAAVLGVIMILIGGIAAVAELFIIKDNKVQKIATIATGALVAVGAILTFFAAEGFYNAFAKANGVDVSQVKDDFKNMGAKTYCGLPVVMGILGLATSGAIIASQFVEKAPVMSKSVASPTNVASQPVESSQASSTPLPHTVGLGLVPPEKQIVVEPSKVETPAPQSGSSDLSELKRQLLQGKITREEFDAKRAELNK